MKRVRERRAEYLAQPENARRARIEKQRAAEDRKDAEHVERASRRRAAGSAVSSELDALFSPSRKHVHERKEWVAVAKIDDRQTGAGPIDLDTGVVELPGRDPGAEDADEMGQSDTTDRSSR